MQQVFTQESLARSLAKKGFTRNGCCYTKGDVRVVMLGNEEEAPCHVPAFGTYFVGVHTGMLVCGGRGRGGRHCRAVVYNRGQDNPAPVTRALRDVFDDPADTVAWQRLFAGYDGGWYVASDILRFLSSFRGTGETALGIPTQNAVMLIVASGVLHCNGMHGTGPSAPFLPACAHEGCIDALREAVCSGSGEYEGLHPLCAPGGVDAGVFQGDSADGALGILSLLESWDALGIPIDTYVFGTIFEQLQAVDHRKGNGIFYTPRALAVDTAMRCVQAHTLFRANAIAGEAYPTFEQACEAGSVRWRHAALESLEELAILDPACGSGHFLEACACAVGDVARKLGGAPPSVASLLHHVHGVDIDERAVWAAWLRLELWAACSGRRKAPGSYALEVRIRCGDAVLAPIIGIGAEEGESFAWQVFLRDAGVENFDIIIGNPPYGKVKNLPISATEKASLSKRYKNAFPSYRGNIDLYKLFVLRALSLAGRETIISFVVPSTMWGDRDSYDIRQKLLARECFYLAFLGLEDSRLFFGAGMHYEVSVFACSAAARGHPVEYIAPDGQAALHIALGGVGHLLPLGAVMGRSALLRIPRYVDPEHEAGILFALDAFERLGGHISSRVGVIDETLGQDHLVSYPTEMMAFSSTHIKDWHVDLAPHPTPKRWVCGWGALSRRPVRLSNGSSATVGEFIWDSHAVVGRQMAHRGERKKLHFALHPGGAVPTNGVRIVYATGRLSPRMLCALLNSTCYNWLFSLFSHTYNVKPYELGELPAVAFSREAARVIETLVDYAHFIAALSFENAAHEYSRHADIVSLLIDAAIFEAWCPGGNMPSLPELMQDMVLEIGGPNHGGVRNGAVGAIPHSSWGTICGVLGRIMEDRGTIVRIGELYRHPWARFCLPHPHNTFKWP